MPSRSRRSKGRVSKPTPLSLKSSNGKKSASAGGSEANSRCSTPNSSTSSITRTRAKVTPKTNTRKGTSSIKKLSNPTADFVSKYESGSDKDHADEFNSESDHSSTSDDEFAVEDDFTQDEQVEDDDWSETGSASLQGKCSVPEIFDVDESEIPILEIPVGSTDLQISGKELLKAVGIYEILRHFHVLLRLSPFRFENFCAALTCDDQCNLLAEIHISLLKTLLREEEGNQTWFGPPDTKDSVNIQFFFLDAMTWYECCRIYLESDQSAEFKKGLMPLTKGSYFEIKLPERLEILHTLTNLFIASNGVREDILKEGNIRYDDHCRNCHK